MVMSPFAAKSIRLAVILLFSSSLSGQQQLPGPVNAQLPWHQAVVDADGRLLAWHHPDTGQGYDMVLRLAWDFIEHKVPNEPATGLKVYLLNAVYDDNTLQGSNWQGNPASLYGQFVDSLLGWYPYSGDEEAVAVVRSMLDYQLAHGTTPTDWDWAGVPYATSCKNSPEYGGCLQDMPREFVGGIETDKLGELGIGYVLFYEMTGERKYLEAGMKCGEALAKHVQPGDADHTPWPFRVDARTGRILGGRLNAHSLEVKDGEDYGGMLVADVRLLDELVRLKAGNAENFRKSRDLAWKWILDYPMRNDRWSGYFEDVPQNRRNLNQAAPTMTAYYLLTRPDPAAVDPEWVNNVGHLIDWVRRSLGRGPYLHAWAIDEQGEPPNFQGCCSRSGLASDTSRWGAINAMYFEKTRDAQAREDAYRSLNYATYFAASDGKISCCGTGFEGQYWFDDGYADYSRNYSWAMGAVPEFAPQGQNHLLRSSSVVQKVRYSKQGIEYQTFDKAATEVLRLTSRPARVRSGESVLTQRADLKDQGYTLAAMSGGDYLVRVRHVQSNTVKIEAPQ
jgi:hypothetical protein